ncbi:hypothetical protein C8J57DRAFT_357726 [Mycena rebaudengoi]|nr:hypothetical protein C8J57DRAFT_357726 [Mycena rebaudengoi]
MSSNKAQHPCILFPCLESKLKPQTTVSLKYILVLNVPSTYPYATLPVLARRSVRVPFLEFRSLGAPPADVGSPGDVYIDHTPAAPRLFCRSETQWTAWPGPSDVDLVAHPDFVDAKWERYLWCSPGLGVEWSCLSTIRRRRADLVAEGVLDDVVASEEEGRALAAKVVGLYLAQEAQGPSVSRTKRKRRVRSYSDAEDDEDEGADDDYDDDDHEPSEPEYSPPKSAAPVSRPLRSAPRRLRTTTTAPSSPPPTPAKPQRDPKAMQRLARELASLTSERAQLVQRKRALQQQLLLATRSPMDKLRDEYQNYAAHASLADTEVTARLAGAVFRLDEGAPLHSLLDDGELTPRVMVNQPNAACAPSGSRGWVSRRTQSRSASRRGRGAEAGDVSWLLFINTGCISRMAYFLHTRVTYFVLFRVLACVIYLF